jgi:hypothetical protein
MERPGINTQNGGRVDLGALSVNWSDRDRKTYVCGYYVFEAPRACERFRIAAALEGFCRSFPFRRIRRTTVKLVVITLQ